MFSGQISLEDLDKKNVVVWCNVSFVKKVIGCVMGRSLDFIRLMHPLKNDPHIITLSKNAAEAF